MVCWKLLDELVWEFYSINALNLRWDPPLKYNTVLPTQQVQVKDEIHLLNCLSLNFWQFGVVSSPLLNNLII